MERVAQMVARLRRMIRLRTATTAYQ